MSSILKLGTPSKFKDPDVLATLCYISDHRIERAVLDLGSSVNLVPYYVQLKLGLGELKSVLM